MQNAVKQPIPAGPQARAALAQIGLTEDQVRRIGDAVAAARSEYLKDIDPANAPGTRAYQAGIRQLRLETLPSGWETGRFNNIEVVVNHDLGVMLGFQNVETACLSSSPQSISSRGEGTRTLVARPYQSDLFNRPKGDRLVAIGGGKKPVAWFVCVAENAESISIEVSRPKPFEGSNFEGFFERIFVVSNESETSEILIQTSTEELDDLDVTISRKTNGNTEY